MTHLLDANSCIHSLRHGAHSPVTGKLGYGTAKQTLYEKIEACFAPARQKRQELLKNPDFVRDVLRQGAVKARAEAQATMKLVRDAVGL